MNPTRNDNPRRDEWPSKEAMRSTMAGAQHLERASARRHHAYDPAGEGLKASLAVWKRSEEAGLRTHWHDEQKTERAEMDGNENVENGGRGTVWSSDLAALDKGERERRALFDEWLQVGICEIVERPDGYAFWLDPDCHIAEHAEEFVTLERRCLPFLGFRVGTDAGHDGPVVEISGPEGAKEFVANHYGIRRQSASPAAPESARSDDDMPAEWDDHDDLDDDEFGLWDGKCQACDAYGRVDDTSLCEECSGKLERDLIRKRDWAYSALAFGCPKDRLEELRNEIVRRYGARLEMLAEEKKPARAPREDEGSGGNR